MKDLLTSGVHFGHQTRRWNPKMKQFIFGERGGIYIIDLQKTTVLIDEACDFLKKTAERGGSVLFVGTKKQCQETIKEQAERVGMPYVANRWLGGLLTNYSTLSKRIKRMHELRELSENGSLDLLPTREAMQLRADLRKLEQNLGGVANMDRLPAAVFVVDPRKEAIVVKEARKLKIPIIGLVDTNCDPDEIDYIIPGNDDAIRSCSLIIRTMADAVAQGRQLLTEAEMKAEAERKAAEEAAVAAAVAAAEAEKAEQAAAAAADAEAKAAEAEAPAAEAKPAAKAKPAAEKAPKAEAKPAAKAEAKPAAKAEAKPAAKAEAKPAAKKAPAQKPAAEAKAAPEAATAESKPAEKAEKKADAPKAEDKPAKKPAAEKADAPKAEKKAEAKAEGPKTEKKAEEPKTEKKAEEPKAEAETPAE
ncbi:MAG: 30S ribosomal protein S2 [Actinobacteria bacterium]|nr:30S ribosomal protein S2 [Actinomycetota bacterium]